MIQRYCIIVRRDAWARLLMVIVTPLTNQGVCWAFMADSRSMSLTGRLIVRVSAFSQRTGNIRIKRNETRIANGCE